jgi:hypothetical protein
VIDFAEKFFLMPDQLPDRIERKDTKYIKGRGAANLSEFGFSEKTILSWKSNATLNYKHLMQFLEVGRAQAQARIFHLFSMPKSEPNLSTTYLEIFWSP